MHTLRFPIAHRIHLAASFFGTNDEFAWGSPALTRKSSERPQAREPNGSKLYYV
jgi:hypothetical protein